MDSRVCQQNSAASLSLENVRWLTAKLNRISVFNRELHSWPDKPQLKINTDLDEWLMLDDTRFSSFGDDRIR